MLTESAPDLLPSSRTLTGGVRRALAIGTALVLGTLVMVGLALGAGSPAASRLDSSAEGINTPVTMGGALSQISTGFTNDLHEAYTSNPLYWDPHLRDHAKLTITPSNDGCGASGKELIRPFYVNSGAQSGDPSSFKWCEGDTCHLSLEMGGDTLHHDVGFLKLRGCPVKEGYTVPYLRIMKVLMGAYDALYLGWGACDAAETSCEVGGDATLAVGDCKTFSHPSRPAMNYDLCYQGPGRF